MEAIVVGTDGSDRSTAAVKWAASEAALRGSRLSIVLAWLLPPSANLSRSSHAERRAAAEAALEEARSLAVRAAGGAPLEVTASLVEGDTIPVLLGASERAELLVVGGGSHGGLSSLLRASTSLQCVLHARCPVAVIRASDDSARASRGTARADGRQPVPASRR